MDSQDSLSCFSKFEEIDKTASSTAGGDWNKTAPLCSPSSPTVFKTAVSARGDGNKTPFLCSIPSFWCEASSLPRPPRSPFKSKFANSDLSGVKPNPLSIFISSSSYIPFCTAVLILPGVAASPSMLLSNDVKLFSWRETKFLKEEDTNSSPADGE